MVNKADLASTKLIDHFGRVHTSLRISVTDRCNIRCFYCMPEGELKFLPRSQLLTFEEIAQFAAVCVQLGVTKFRLTGGEPLIRQGLPSLVEMLCSISGVEEVALTTNGMLLTDQATALKSAGLHRINVSLDTLDEHRFEQIARRPGLPRVLDGIAAAQAAGFKEIRLNSIAVRGITEHEIVELVRFAIRCGLHLRFIEFMPLDAESQWTNSQVLTGSDIRRIVSEQFGQLVAIERQDPSQPAVDYLLGASGKEHKIGFISSVSEPFCASCNRLRLTADGQVRNCLFSTVEWDARACLRNGGSDTDLKELIASCVSAKKPGHGIDSPEFLRPDRAMYQIGG